MIVIKAVPDPFVEATASASRTFFGAEDPDRATVAPTPVVRGNDKNDQAA